MKPVRLLRDPAGARHNAGHRAIPIPEPFMRKSLLVVLLSLSASACTWVHMAPGASAVRVASAAPASCDKRGEVEVSVKHSIALIERNALRVREELETLARNEAPGLGADTIHPLGEPAGGTQRFAAWRCAR